MESVNNIVGEFGVNFWLAVNNDLGLFIFWLPCLTLTTSTLFLEKRVVARYKYYDPLPFFICIYQSINIKNHKQKKAVNIQLLLRNPLRGLCNSRRDLAVRYIDITSLSKASTYYNVGCVLFYTDFVCWNCFHRHVSRKEAQFYQSRI